MQGADFLAQPCFPNYRNFLFSLLLRWRRFRFFSGFLNDHAVSWILRNDWIHSGSSDGRRNLLLSSVRISLFGTLISALLFLDCWRQFYSEVFTLSLGVVLRPDRRKFLKNSLERAGLSVRHFSSLFRTLSGPGSFIVLTLRYSGSASNRLQGSPPTRR